MPYSHSKAERRRMAGLVRMKEMRIPRGRELPFSDFIYEKTEANKNRSQDLLKALGTQTGYKWDLIDLHKRVFEDSSIWYSLRNSHYPYKICEKKGEVFYLQAESYDQLQQNFSKNFRKALRKKKKRLSGVANPEFVCIKDKADLNWAFQDFIDLEGSGWKGREGRAIIRDRRHLRFYENLRNNFSETGSVELHLQKDRDRSIAGLFCLRKGETVYA